MAGGRCVIFPLAIEFHGPERFPAQLPFPEGLHNDSQKTVKKDDIWVPTREPFAEFLLVREVCTRHEKLE